MKKLDSLPAKKICMILYILLATGVGVAYVTTRSQIINTQAGWQTISNLTVNYVVAAFATGALSGWYFYNRLLAKQPTVIRFGGTVLAEFIVAILWLAVMSAGGYETRWG